MAIPVSAATNAYTAISQLTSQGAPTGGQSSTDFSDLLKQAVQSVVDSGRQTDRISVEALAGNANVVDVVTAMAETELALETMVSVRDRIVSAYEEIMRMPI
ncbi:MAG: flagellar hook-basal body complex protein FliE [Fimbriimonadaceae bacterium]|nr:flagellar hook-basal body complex protein FliE [Alphaproteobacteria bacterium]